MRVKDVMSDRPACCTPDTSLREAAQMMEQCDCGAIPVVDSANRKKPLGVITDRDLAVRAVARGRDPNLTPVSECMSRPLATIHDDSSIEDCCDVMETSRVRRLLVVNEDGELCGIVAQADIALQTGEDHTFEVVREVSLPTKEASLVC